MNDTPVAALENVPLWGDESCITAEGVHLVEDLQEIQKAYSRRPIKSRLEMPQEASLDLWSHDLSQRLNDGDVTIENIVAEFNASLVDQNHLAFKRIGRYCLRLERGDETQDWVPVLDTEKVEPGDS